MAKALDAGEEGFAQVLARAGLRPAAARVLATLARGGGHGATELAAATGLARQEAGEAANELARLGIARVEKVPSGGRPSNRYHLAPEGLAGLIAARRRALAEEAAALDELERRYCA